MNQTRSGSAALDHQEGIVSGCWAQDVYRRKRAAGAPHSVRHALRPTCALYVAVAVQADAIIGEGAIDEENGVVTVRKDDTLIGELVGYEDAVGEAGEIDRSRCTDRGDPLGLVRELDDLGSCGRCRGP